jgi:hypothetical protein
LDNSIPVCEYVIAIEQQKINGTSDDQQPPKIRKEIRTSTWISATKKKAEEEENDSCS